MISTGNRSGYTMGNGDTWVDAISGILNVSLGHASDVVLDAITRVDFINCYDKPSIPKATLCSALAAYQPGYQWALLNTGAEAVERAIQCAIVKRGPDACNRVVVFNNAFHGKTLSTSGIRYDVPWRSGIEFVKVGSVEEFEQLAGPVDAVLFEPVQGWQGDTVDMLALREACTAKGCYMIADEMITGFLRCEHRFMSGGIADMIVGGKGLAQGLPLAVLGVDNQLPDLPIGWTTTAGGNALCARVGVAVLEHLVQHEGRHKLAISRISHQLAKIPGAKVFGALAFVKSPNIQRSRFIIEQHRVIASYHDDVIRLAPCFTISPWSLSQITDAVKESLK